MSHPPKRPTKKQQAAMDAAYEARKQVLTARTARDAATPPWLKALRQYIDAAIQHHLAMYERDEDGYASSDMAGEEQCEELWTQVVAAMSSSMELAGGTPSQEPCLTVEVRPYEMSAEAMADRRKKRR